MEIAEFINKLEDLYTWTLEESNRGLNAASTQRITKRQLFIRAVTRGSVNCETTISVGDASLVGTVANGITSGLKSNPNVGGVAITGGSAVANVITAESV
jgi:hypothetical protein